MADNVMNEIDDENIPAEDIVDDSNEGIVTDPDDIEGDGNDDSNDGAIVGDPDDVVDDENDDTGDSGDDGEDSPQDDSEGSDDDSDEPEDDSEGSDDDSDNGDTQAGGAEDVGGDDSGNDDGDDDSDDGNVNAGDSEDIDGEDDDEPRIEPKADDTPLFESEGPFISQVERKKNNTIYEIKDSEARDAITQLKSDLNELDDELDTKPTVTSLGQLNSGDSITVELNTQHIYLLVGRHPDRDAFLYILCPYGSRSNPYTAVITTSDVTISLTGATLTVSCVSNSTWPMLLDLGLAGR